VPSSTSDGRAWPRLTVVTPSFNQARFLEETLRSILLQGYPDLEYLVMDGGSTDGSVEIIKKYAPWLAYWTSGRDGGQSAAINRGLEKGTGEFATWINSDDLLCKDALVNHAIEAGFDLGKVYVGHCAYIDEHGTIVSSHRGRVSSLEDLVRIEAVWRSKDDKGQIDQPAVLFPRALALSVGALDPDNHYTMDYELWGKFLIAGAEFEYTDVRFGMFRRHDDQKTHDGLRQTRHLIATAEKLIAASPSFPEARKRELRLELQDYMTAYEPKRWRRSGRLARIGLPSCIVTPIRGLKVKLGKIVSAFSAA
jgi:glycosyltransferase involved in cell wall biosynthesis